MSVGHCAPACYATGEEGANHTLLTGKIYNILTPFAAIKHKIIAPPYSFLLIAGN